MFISLFYYLWLIAPTAAWASLSFLEERERSRYLRSSHGAGTAIHLRNAIWVLADQFTFWFRAIWLVALPIAPWLFTNRLTFWLWRLAVSHAMWLLANSHTFRAVEHLAALIGTFDLTLWFFTFNITYGILRLSAGSVALGRLTDRIANRRAVWVITLPRALWVAGCFS